MLSHQWSNKQNNRILKNWRSNFACHILPNNVIFQIVNILTESTHFKVWQYKKHFWLSYTANFTFILCHQNVKRGKNILLLTSCSQACCTNIIAIITFLNSSFYCKKEKKNPLLVYLDKKLFFKSHDLSRRKDIVKWLLHMGVNFTKGLRS